MERTGERTRDIRFYSSKNGDICYFHGDALEIVQKLLQMDQMTLNQFADSLAATRQHVSQMHQAALAAMPSLRQSAFASGDVEDILFFRIANGLPIE